MSHMSYMSSQNRLSKTTNFGNTIYVPNICVGYILAYNVDAQCVQRNCEAPIAIQAHFILSGNV